MGLSPKVAAAPNRPPAVRRPERTRARRGDATWSVALSLAMHALFASGVLILAVRGLEKADVRDARAVAAARALEAAHEPGTVDVEAWIDRESAPPTTAGGARTPRIDTGAAGRGGETAEEAARHLADRDDDMRTTPESSTLHAYDQVQRIESAKTRASWEDRRATTHPMEQGFVVTGVGSEEERRARSERDPSRGALASRTSGVDGHGAPADRTREAEAAESLTRAGAIDPGTVAAPGLGTRNGRDDGSHRASARVTMARPDVTMGPVTVPAAERGRVKDDVDSRQAVASAVEAIVHASYAGGAPGEGRGGTEGGGVAGAGGAAAGGSHPRPMGAGSGDWIEMDTTDPALSSYFRRLKAKMSPALARAFPKEAALDLKQGFVIVELTIQKDGAIQPRLVRPSGIDEYDKNCLAALRGIQPEPLPSAALRERPSLRVRGRFEATNPVVK